MNKTIEKSFPREEEALTLKKDVDYQYNLHRRKLQAQYAQAYSTQTQSKRRASHRWSLARLFSFVFTITLWVLTFAIFCPPAIDDLLKLWGVGK